MKLRQGKPKRIKIVALPPRKSRRRIPILSALWDWILAIAAEIGRYGMILLPLIWLILILIIFWSVQEILSLGRPTPVNLADLHKVEQGKLLEAIGAIVIGCVGFSLILRPTLRHSQRYAAQRSGISPAGLSRSGHANPHRKKTQSPTAQPPTALAPDNSNNPPIS
jgi:hypothetical protein